MANETPKSEPGFVPGSRPLCPRHEIFAQEVAKGKRSAKAVYLDLYPDSSPESAETDGPRLLRSAQVRARVDFLQGKGVEAAAIEVSEVLNYLMDAVRTPIGEIDENSPLSEEVTITDTRLGRRVKVKSISKKGAIELLGKFNGWFKPTEMNLNAGYVVPDEIRESVGRLALAMHGRGKDVEAALEALGAPNSD